MPNRDKLDIAIAGGMRQDLSEHNAPPGTIIDALNVRFSAVGEVEARPGTEAVSFASDCDVTYANLVTSTSEPTLARMPDGFFVGAKGFGYRYSATKGRMHAGGSYANAEPLGVLATIAHEEQGGTTVRPYPVSQAAQNGYVCVVYSAGASLLSDRIEALVYTEAGVLVANITALAISAFVVADGSSSTDFILVTQSATTALEARVITTSATGATVGAAVSVGTLLASTSYWAVCRFPSLGWLLVYKTAADTITVTALSGTASFDTVTITVLVTTDKVSVFADAANVYVGWKDGVGTYNAQARAFDTSLTLTSGGTVTLATEAIGDFMGPPLFGASVSAGTAMYAIGRFASSAFDNTAWTEIGTFTAAGVATPFTDIDQAVPASAPFGQGYLWVVAGAGSGSNFIAQRSLLLDFMGQRTTDANATFAVASPVIALAGNTGAIGSSAIAWGMYRQHLSAPAQLSDGTWLAGLTRKVREDTVSALCVAEWLRFRIGGSRSSCRLGLEALVAGWLTVARSSAGTRQYEGATDTQLMREGVDVGFPVYPSLATPTSSNSTGSLTSGGSYQWRAVLERIDYNGVRWRSAPSPVVTLTLGGADDTVALVAYANPYWLRAQAPTTKRLDSQFVMHFYRTVNGGSTFYRATPATGAPSVISGNAFNFDDTVSDALLSQREVLYTDGGVLANDAPPSCRFVTATEDRVWLAGLWETEQLQSSKILVPGEPPQFSDSPAFRVVLPEPCTGIAVQDGVLIAFSKGAVYAVQGGGPNDQGQGAWDSPRCITNSTGCISAPSILVTSVGVFFQSGQGIELLPRGMGEPVFIGMPVQDLMYGTTVVSAAVVTTFRGRTARFVLSTGSVLVYDLDTQAWSRDAYGRNIAAIADTDAGAVMALSTMESSYGALLEQLDEDQDSVGNSPSEVASSLEWAELRPFGVAGQGRFTGAVALFDGRGTPSDGYRAGNATITLSVDRFSENGLIFNMNSLSGADYRKNTAANDVGTAGKLRLTTTVGGWRFVGWSVEIDDRGGGRRMGETEQG